MDRRDLLKLGPCSVVALILRRRVQPEGRRIRRSKPYMNGWERGCLSRADVRELEERDRC